MEALSLVQVRDFFIVLAAIMAFIVLVGNAVKAIRELKRPSEDERENIAQWRTDMDENVTDNTERIHKIEDGNKVIMRALIAMLNHEINGNSVDKLREALGELNDYLIER